MELYNGQKESSINPYLGNSLLASISYGAAFARLPLALFKPSPEKLH
jgi:hypothetical protein